MKAKRKSNNKLIVSFFLFATIALAAVAAIVTVLALANRTVNSAISLSFIAEDIEGKVTAEYKVSSDANWTKIGEWDFMAKDDQQTKVMSPDAFELNAGDTIEFRYTFRNYGDVDYTGILALDKPTEESNVVVQYKYNSNEYSNNHYGLVVEGLSGAPTSKIKTDNGKQYTEMTYYIQFAADNKGKNGEYNSNFIWDLKEYVAAPGEEIISLSGTTFVEIPGTNTYSAQYNGGDISVSGAAASGVSTQDVTVQNVWYIPSKFGSANVTKVVKGENLPANTKVVFGDAITTLEEGTFGFYDMYDGNHYGTSGLVELVLGNGMTTLPFGSFTHCQNLKRVTLPNTLTNLGIGAFYNCSQLKDVKIPNGVTRIPSDAFNRTAIEEIEIPNSVTDIDSIAFGYCPNLKTVKFGNGLKKIGMSAFAACTALEKVELPDGLEKIEVFAFEGCTGLKEITIPSSVTCIGSWAFSMCTGVEVLNYNASVTPVCTERELFCGLGENATKTVVNINSTVVQDYLFLECIYIDEVNFGENVVSIGQYAFSTNWGLTSVVIPDSVQTIGLGAFEYCNGVKTVTIGKNVREIGQAAFAYCSSLKTIWIPKSVVTFVENGLATFYQGTVVYCEAASMPTGWNVNDSIMGMGVQFKFNYTYEAYLAEINK